MLPSWPTLLRLRFRHLHFHSLRFRYHFRDRPARGATPSSSPFVPGSERGGAGTKRARMMLVAQRLPTTTMRDAAGELPPATKTGKKSATPSLGRLDVSGRAKGHAGNGTPRGRLRARHESKAKATRSGAGEGGAAEEGERKSGRRRPGVGIRLALLLRSTKKKRRSERQEQRHRRRFSAAPLRPCRPLMSLSSPQPK